MGLSVSLLATVGYTTRISLPCVCRTSNTCRPTTHSSGRGGRCGWTSRGGYGDIIGKGTTIIDCSEKIMCEPPVVIDDELDVVRARQEWDGGGKGVGWVRWAVVRLGL